MPVAPAPHTYRIITLPDGWALEWVPTGLGVVYGAGFVLLPCVTHWRALVSPNRRWAWVQTDRLTHGERSLHLHPGYWN